MKRMLFNATQSEELRVAIVDGQKLIDLDIERGSRALKKSNIYKGIVTRVEPSLEAAFVNYGTERHGFLPFKEISPQYFKDSTQNRPRIQDVIEEGQEIIVQVTKEERGNKGAALSSYLSLAGRYIVLMPNNPDGGGVSRRVEGEERNEFRDHISNLDITEGMSVIGRTAGVGSSLEELQWDLNYLKQLWTAIEEASQGQSGAFLIYQEGNLVIRAIRDYFHPEIGEILIDTQEIYDQATQFMNHVMPNYVDRVKLYEDEVSLFSRFQIEHQIESAFSREVRLPSGGAIVIDHTEALVSIDVNSSRATKGSDIEHTAFNTNIEAAEEVAKQLRLRDLGGLIVIDFIDMESQKNQREVENRFRDALHHDRARVQTGKISRFGLLELSRQRLRPSIGESSNSLCTKCNGTGSIRDIQSSALHILRMIQEEAMKEHNATISAQLPIEVATFLLNEKRSDIYSLEQRLKVEIILIPNKHLESPNYSISSAKQEDIDNQSKPSYQMMESLNEGNQVLNYKQASSEPKQEPLVKGIVPDTPAPTGSGKPNKTLFGFFKNLIAGDDENTQNSSEEKSEVSETTENNRPRPQNNNRGRNNRNQKFKQQHNNKKPQGEAKPSETDVTLPSEKTSPAETRPNQDNNRRGRNNNNSRGRFNKDRGTRSNQGPNDFEKKALASQDAPTLNKSAPEARVPQVTKSEPKPIEASKKPTPPKPRKRVEEKPVDLKAVGLELVETKAKSKPKAKKEVEEKPKKVAPKKTAAWQKKEKAKDEPIVMVETKATKKKPAK
ncbi:Rne/Rng family ribonuclease [Candidatus Methylopumilus planktonicus]|uniref:Rne/Rng family ribonuclease n=1 Tax=Candidatus Methylopumilus planktonicus TaxID=1581557 RepID=UPI003D18D14B